MSFWPRMQGFFLRENKVYEILCQELSSKIIQSFFNPTFSVKYVKSVAKKPQKKPPNLIDGFQNIFFLGIICSTLLASPTLEYLHVHCLKLQELIIPRGLVRSFEF